MEEWKEYRLGDVGIITTGKTPKTSVDEYYGGNIPFVTPADINTPYKYVTETVRYLTDKGLTSIASNSIDEGSICVSCIGNLGYAGIVQKRCASNQQINSITVRNEFDRDFVYYAIKRLWPLFKNHEGQSTTVSILNKGQFSKITIKCPSLVVQKRISSILSSLDDKIECNRRINDNLLQQTQAIYKSWFVDFEPFLDGEFVESELGMIPKGWEVGKLFDVAEVLDKYRKPLSGQERDLMDKIYPYYGATSCMDYVDDYLFDGIYTLIGEDGSVVKEDGLPYMQYVWGKLWVNNHAHILQGKNGFSTEMLHVMLSTTNIRHLVTGAVQAKLSQANMQKILVAIPSTNILDEIRPKFDKLYQLIRKNEDESHHLSQLRDTLLPRLMSGKLKVNELTM